MTREEAKTILGDYEYILFEDEDTYNREAFRMAIKALEQEPYILDRRIDENTVVFRTLDGKEVEYIRKEPCEDAISREAVSDALLDYWHDIQCVDSSGYDVYEDCKAIIDELPSVTPSRRKGEWLTDEIIHADGYKYTRTYCSECQTEYIPKSTKYIKFCPQCGAKMESEDKE